MPLKNEEITNIFRDVYPNLCRFLKSMIGRDFYAQDIAQESFLRLCQADFGDIQPAEIRFWLFRVARNLALNEISKSKTRTNFLNKAISIFQKSEPSPAELLIENERQKQIRALLKQLPEHQRSALLLREQEEMNYKQIALILDISESKVKIDIFRARQSLRLLWHEHCEKTGDKS